MKTPRAASTRHPQRAAKRRSRLVIAAIATIGTVALCGSARAQCRKDTECKGARICEAGRCVAPTRPDGALHASARVGDAPAASPAPPAARSASASSPPPPPAARRISRSAAVSDWLAFRLEGTHLFAGISLMPGASVGVDYGSGGTTNAVGGLAFAFRFGALLGRTELGVELSPVATVVDFDARANLTLGAYVGQLIALTDRLYWPLRFGVGLLAVNTPGDEVLFQARADLLGVGYKVGHLLIEANLPSFRFTTEFDDGAILSWGFNLSATYVF